MEFIDIAGLVEGASKGEGLGNQFLGHIRSTDAICHVVRCFADPEVIHVAGGVNPLHDIDIINTELLLADLDTVEKRYAKVEKLNKPPNADHKIKVEFATLGQAARGASSRQARPHRRPHRRREALHPRPASHHRQAAALRRQCRRGRPHRRQILGRPPSRSAPPKKHSQVVRICGAMESEIAQLEPAERDEFLKEMGLEEPGLNRLIHSAYRLLDLITYFTAGVQEVRAWTIVRGTKAPGAAGVIHSDFEKGFIKADCYHCEDLFKYGSEQAVKEKGPARSEGKEYVVKDGDILFFKFNV
jgi:ribosome-binding ATPase YchF (GTP1/OBG family)